MGVWDISIGHCVFCVISRPDGWRVLDDAVPPHARVCTASLIQMHTSIRHGNNRGGARLDHRAHDNLRKKSTSVWRPPARWHGAVVAVLNACRHMQTWLLSVLQVQIGQARLGQCYPPNSCLLCV